MGYYTTDITVSRIDATGLGLVVTAHTSHRDKVLQCYVSGDLISWACPEDGTVRFVLPQAGPADTILLLAVDADDRATDYWPDAFGAPQRYGSRIHVSLRRDLLDGRRPGDVWRVYRGEAGGASATIKLHEAEVYPGGRGATGWGFDWGRGAWGYSGSNAPGWGRCWGHTWGFGTDSIGYVTEPLPRGTYPIKVELADEHGNVSNAHEAVVTVDTFARPAQGLAVSSFDRGADRLVLAMTPSEDIS